MLDLATLELPAPRLAEGRSVSIGMYTDEALFQATGVRIAFFERLGGVSTGAYESLNAATHVNDDLNPVLENRRRALRAAGFDLGLDRLIVPNQVHGTNLVVCDDAARVPECRDLAAQGADGLVVTCDDVAAMLCFADCVPVILVAPTGDFAVVHAGWRGVVARISEKAAAKLSNAAGVAPSQLNVYIGPHIRACCFEVGEEVAARFESEFGAACLTDERHVDMARALTDGLVAAGIDAQRVCDLGVCTVDDDRFFSYRRSGGVCGRHGAFAVRLGVRSSAE